MTIKAWLMWENNVWFIKPPSTLPTSHSRLEMLLSRAPKCQGTTENGWKCHRASLWLCRVSACFPLVLFAGPAFCARSRVLNEMISAPEWMDVLLAHWPEVNQVFKPPIVFWSLIPLPWLSKCSSVCLWAVNLFRFVEFVILFTWTSGVWSNSIWLGRVRSPQDFHHQQALNANDLSALTTAVL